MKLDKQQFQSWRHGAAGFLQWISDTQPHIPNSRGKYVPFEPAPFQVKDIERALATDAKGDFKYGTIVLCYPRRHSKTTLAALLVLWRFTTRTGENILCLSNSKTQSASASYGLCRRIVLNSPFLRTFIGADNVFREKMEIPKLNNIMQSVPCNESSLYGQKVTVGWTSEVHAATSDEGLQILGSSLGDSENSWLLLDSTIDATGGVLHRLQELVETKQDKSICFCLTQYTDLDDALRKSPPWIRKDWLKSRHKQLLPAVFSTQHLNQRAESENALFGKRGIDAAKDTTLPHPINKETLEHIAQGRNFVCGSGLDRAYAFSKHGDATVWTTIAKIASHDPNEEAHFYILKQEAIPFSLGKLIKRQVQSDMQEYDLQGIVFESYNSQDLNIWSQERGYPSETVFANNANQKIAFLELHRLFVEQRIHFSSDLKELEKELSSFQYELVQGEPRFGTRSVHDDRVYSLAWSVFSLRQQELNGYCIDSVICNSKSSHAPLCYIRTNAPDGVVLHCSQTCETAIKVNEMYNQYKNTSLDSELTIPEFYANLVTNDGLYAVI